MHEADGGTGLASIAYTQVKSICESNLAKGAGQMAAYRDDREIMDSAVLKAALAWLALMLTAFATMAQPPAQDAPTPAAASALVPAPTLEVRQPEGAQYVGKAFEVVYEVSWDGSPTEFVVLPGSIAETKPAKTEKADSEGEKPASTGPEWGSVELVSVESVIRDGRNVLRQLVRVVPRKEGEFKLPEMKIPYISMAEAMAEAQKAAKGEKQPENPDEKPKEEPKKELPTLKPADEVKFTAKIDRRPLVAACAGAGFLLIVVVTVLIWTRRAKRAAPVFQPDTGRSVSREATEALHEAKRKRLDGEYYEFYLSLAKAADLLSQAGGDDNDTRLASLLKARAENVGYGGARPTDDQMDLDHKDVERALERWRERKLVSHA